MARLIAEAEKSAAQELLSRSRAAMIAVDHYDQATVDRLCRAVAWATANEQTFGRLTRMSVEESGMGSAEGVPARRWKILGILRDALRTRSVGIIEEIPEKGITKYAKPVGVIAGLLPVTNPLVTMVNMAINAIKCRDAVIFSPHPLSKRTALEIARVIRAALKKQGAPEDLILCLERPSIPLAQELMSVCDLTIATGGTAMVKAAYGSGKPAYGVGAGNATVVVDETADVADAARNTRISKTQNHGSGCSSDGNLLVEASVYDAFSGAVAGRRGLSRDRRRKGPARGGDVGRGRPSHDRHDRPRRWRDRRSRGFPPSRRQVVHHRRRRQDRQSAPLLGREAVAGAGDFQVPRLRSTRSGWCREILEVGGKGHSVGIASFDDDHIHRLASMAPVSRIMVRQPNVSGNAGSFTNGMPMTASLGCGTWGGNITSENISVKHYMNTTWVSRSIPEGPAVRTGAAWRVLQLRSFLESARRQRPREPVHA